MLIYQYEQYAYTNTYVDPDYMLSSSYFIVITIVIIFLDQDCPTLRETALRIGLSYNRSPPPAPPHTHAHNVLQYARLTQHGFHFLIYPVSVDTKIRLPLKYTPIIPTTSYQIFSAQHSRLLTNYFCRVLWHYMLPTSA